MSIIRAATNPASDFRDVASVQDLPVAESRIAVRASELECLVSRLSSRTQNMGQAFEQLRAEAVEGLAKMGVQPAGANELFEALGDLSDITWNLTHTSSVPVVMVPAKDIEALYEVSGLFELAAQQYPENSDVAADLHAAAEAVKLHNSQQPVVPAAANDDTYEFAA